jgi:hypothetical protein
MYMGQYARLGKWERIGRVGGHLELVTLFHTYVAVDKNAHIVHWVLLSLRFR